MNDLKKLFIIAFIMFFVNGLISCQLFQKHKVVQNTDKPKRSLASAKEKTPCDKIDQVISTYPGAGHSEGNSPLHLTAKCCLVDKSLELIEQGYDPLQKNDFGEIPLHEAAGNNCTGLVGILTQYGSLNAQNKIGETPLHEACERCHKETAMVLVQAGADPTIKSYSMTRRGKNFKGETAYKEAMEEAEEAREEGDFALEERCLATARALETQGMSVM